MDKTINKYFKKIWTVLVAFVCCFSLMSVSNFGMEQAEARISEEGNTLTEEELAEPIEITDPSGRVTFIITQISDGNAPERCLVNTANGFSVPETNSRDGILCLGDVAQYKISYNIKDSTTATTVKMRIPTVYENRDGEPLTNINGQRLERYELGQLNKLAQGGTGFFHTGSITGNIMTMNFPPSTSTASLDVGKYDLKTDQAYPAGVDQVLNLRAQFLDSSNRVIAESEGFPNPIRVVGTSVWDPQLRTLNKSTPNVYKENGETYYEYTVSLQMPNTTVDGNVYGAPTGDFNYLNQNAKVTVDASRFPTGSILIPKNNQTIVEGTNVVYEESVINSQSAVRNTNFEMFSVRIPVSALDSEETVFEWNASISKYESTVSYNSQIANASPFLNFEGFMGQQGYEPGMDQNQNFNTRTVLDGREITKTGVDYPNNDWAKMELKIEPFGNWTKHIHNDVEGKVGSQNLHASTSEAAVFAGTPVWSEFGTYPFSGKLTNATYCDVWDNRLQYIDTERSPITQMRNDAGEWSDVETTILYSTSSPSFNNEAVSELNITRQQANCSNETLNWTEEPTENTNMVKIVFDGEYDAFVSGADKVQRAQIPFKTLSNAEYKEWATFPAAKAVYNSLMHNNNGSWASSRVIEEHYIRGESFNVKVNGLAGRHQNAGTTQYINGLGQFVFDNYLSTNAEPFEIYPELKYEISPLFSAIQVEDFIYDDYEVTITNADFGSDGLPGTADDVSPWIVNLKSKNSYTISSTMPSNAFSKLRLGDTWIKGTVPPYIKAGTNVQNIISFVPDQQIIDAFDIPADNRAQAPTVINAVSSMAQSKWSMNQTEFAGDSVGWGISYSNTSAFASGETIVYDILPHVGDSNGTTLTKPLSNIEFNIIQGDLDMRIEVTDADPTTLNEETMKDGSIDFVALENQDQLEGEITAFKITEDTVELNAIRLIQVTADTESDQANNRMYNGLLEGTVVGLSLPMPATTPVITNLVTGEISGTIYYDDNNNGSLNSEEPTRYEGTLVELLDELGNVVDTTYSDNSGNYVFTKVRGGNYTVQVRERGENIEDYLDQTGTLIHEVTLTTVNNSVGNLNFGYHTDLISSITVTKRMVGQEEGVTLNHGTEVVFEAVVTNDGDVILNNIVVNDNMVGLFVCPNTTLEVGESMVCSVTAIYEAT